MTAASSLIIDVVDFRRRIGARRAVDADLHLVDLDVGERSVVAGRLHVEVIVEAATGGVVLSGSVSGVGRAPCRRCLDPVDEAFIAELREIFENEPTDGETWPIQAERIDATPAVREAALLSLPLVPLCRGDCEGPEPGRFPTGPAHDLDIDDDPDALPRRDARWAALDGLTFDD